MTDLLATLALALGRLCQTNRCLLATAESCTGGLVAELITAVPGSSALFERGFVTYSNLAKQEMLGVPKATIEQYGAVSEQTAIAMALGALKHSHAHMSVAITGIAGPDGGSADKPVGTVWFAWAKKNGTCQAQLQHFTGDRVSIREQAAEFALNQLIQLNKTNG
jgi:nicotinamide-nucleotide amidase